ncbi:hypothetical protein, partial [Yersinia pseudotuberculosis]|uniref:hypothetical protein n=1 Tax=Yersinia pseudotuberculosis TaxID=633 RepID=UPI001F296385
GDSTHKSLPCLSLKIGWPLPFPQGFSILTSIMIASDARHGLKFLQLVGILSEGGKVECGIRHKMHRRAGNLSGEKTNKGKA